MVGQLGGHRGQLTEPMGRLMPGRIAATSEKVAGLTLHLYNVFNKMGSRQQHAWSDNSMLMSFYFENKTNNKLVAQIAELGEY